VLLKFIDDDNNDNNDNVDFIIIIIIIIIIITIAKAGTYCLCIFVSRTALNVVDECLLICFVELAKNDRMSSSSSKYSGCRT